MLYQGSGLWISGRVKAVPMLVGFLAFVCSAAPSYSCAGPSGQVQARSPEETLRTWERQLIQSPEMSARLSWAEKSLRPSGRQKLERMARLLAPGIATGTAFSGLQKQAELDVIASFAGLAGKDVSEAAFIVMAMATKDMDDDLRMIMAEIKAMTAAQQQLRDLIHDLNSWNSQQMSGHHESEDIEQEETGTSSAPLRVVRPPRKAQTLSVRPIVLKKESSPVIHLEYLRTPVIPPLPPRDSNVTIEGLKALRDDLKGKLDGMNEMSEMTSLRLQLTMDRRSKIIQTLSQMMRKISTTQDILVQNIK